MISQELLEMLRCPMDPHNTRLDAEYDALVCQRCKVRFPIKEGIPCMLIDEAKLPPGCTSVRTLPCQKAD